MTTSSDSARRAGTTSERRGSYGQGGPIFLPQRKLSPMAQAILAQPTDVDRVTAYDEIWHHGFMP